MRIRRAPTASSAATPLCRRRSRPACASSRDRRRHLRRLSRVVAAGRGPGRDDPDPGVEINALVTRDLGLWEGELHILGFGMDPDDDAFEAAMAAQRGRRRERFWKTVDRLREIGLPIDPRSMCRARRRRCPRTPMIARALIAAGFASSVEDAFARIIGHGAPGYVRREGLGPEEAIRVVRAAEAILVLAHFGEAPARLELLRELVEIGAGRPGGLRPQFRCRDGHRGRRGRVDARAPRDRWE